MRKLALLLILLLGSLAPAATTVNVYVDPDSASTPRDGSDFAHGYLTLNAALAAKAKDIVASDEIYVFHLQSSGGTDDTTAATVGTGWTTDATRYIQIQQDDLPTNGVYDGTKYVLDAGAGAIALTISEDYVRIVGLQINVVAATTGNDKGISTNPPGGATSDIWISKLILPCSSTSTGNVYGISVPFAATVKIWNSTIYGWVSGTDASHYGIFVGNASAAVEVYNCTLYNNFVDVYRNNGTVTVKNCIVNKAAQVGADCFSGTQTISNCLSDDGDGTNPQTPSGSDWANELTNAAAGNFALVAGGNAIDNGLTDPGGTWQDDSDLIATARPTGAAWDIGAFELPASAPDQVTTPAPADTATDQTIAVDISWAAAGGATSYDVYFGTDATPDNDGGSSEFIGNQAGLSYDPGSLAYSTTYYWRIDSKNGTGTTTGLVWSFTTAAEPVGGLKGGVFGGVVR